MDRWNQEPQFSSQMTPQRLYPLQHLPALLFVDQRNQLEADLKAQLVEAQNRCQILRLLRRFFSRLAFRRRSLAFHHARPRVSQRHGRQQKRELGQTGNQTQRPQHSARHIKRRSIPQQLRSQLCRQLSGRRGPRQHHSARDRDQQRRNHRHQSVAHRQNRVGAHRFAQVNSLLQRPDQQPGHDIDGGNQNRGQRVALVEACSPVHRPVKLGLLRDRLPPLSRRRLIDQSRVHVRIDGHLLARQRVEREARRHLGGAHGAVAHH